MAVVLHKNMIVLPTPTQALRWLFYGVVAAFEATLAMLGVLLVSTFLPYTPAHWGVLFGVVCVAMLAAAHWERIGGKRARRRTLLMCFAVVVWATKAQAGGDVLPWQGWLQLVQAADTELIYVALIVSLWCWWRGLNAANQTHATLVQLLRRSVVAVAGIGTLLALVGGLGSATDGAQAQVVQQQLIISVVALLGLGLLGLVLARLVAGAERATTPARWRSLRSGMVLTLGVLLMGSAVTIAFSPAAATVLRTALGVVLVVVGVLLWPLAWLLFQMLTGLQTLMRRVWAPAGALQPPRLPLDTLIDNQIMVWLIRVPTYVLALLPLVVLVIAILLLHRRRERGSAEADEEHESLFSWAIVGHDLRALLPQRGGSGLRAVLRSLTGTDPVVRIRRRYVQALLLGEAAQQARRPPQTPAEYGSQLSVVSGGHSAAVEALTTTYQRARYAPDLVTRSDAEAADAAWQQLGTKE